MAYFYNEQSGMYYVLDKGWEGLKKVTAGEYKEGKKLYHKNRLAETVQACTERRDGKPIIRTVLRHVSASGMSRIISAYVVTGSGLQNLSFDAAYAMGEKPDDSRGQWACKIGGCGMDMGFHLAESIARMAGLNLQDFLHEWT